MARCLGCEIVLADPTDCARLAAHVLHHLNRLEFAMSQFSSDQAHLDTDVQALTGIFSQLEATIADLKAKVAAGQPVDFAGADQLVADGQAYLNPPTTTATGEPDVSNVPSDASTVVPPSAIVPGSATDGAAVVTDVNTGAEMTGTLTDTATSSDTPPSTSATLYEHTSTDAVDATAWPTANVVAADGSPLYTFSGDTKPGDQNGASAPGWTVYTGPTTPATA